MRVFVVSVVGCCVKFMCDFVLVVTGGVFRCENVRMVSSCLLFALHIVLKDQPIHFD